MNNFEENMRPRRSSKTASINFEDAEEWEDTRLERCEQLPVHPTRWVDPDVLLNWQVGDDFYHFFNVTGLLGFATNRADTYEWLSKEFLATFKFDYQKR